MSINLVAAVMQALQPELVTKIAGALGIDRGAAMKAVSAAVPAVLGGFARKAASPEGPAELAAVWETQTPDALGKLAASLGSPQQVETLQAGLKLLERVTGGSAKDVLISALGKYAGIDPLKMAGLLGIIAPIVTSILASYQRAGVGNGGGIAKLLAAQQASIDTALPSKFAADFVGIAAPSPATVSGTFAAATSTAIASAAAAVLSKPAVETAIAEAKVVADEAKAATSDVVAALKPAAKPPEAAANPQAPPAADGDQKSRLADRVLAAAEAQKGEKSSVAVAEAVPPTAKPVAAPPPATEVKQAVAPPPPAASPKAASPSPSPAAKTPPTRATNDGAPDQPIVARRRGVPIAAWLVPLLLLIGGAGWWWQSSIENERASVAAEQARRLADQKAADEETAKKRQIAEAEAAAAKQKAEADAAAAKAADDARQKAETERTAIAASQATAESDAKKKAEADQARGAVEAEAKRKADAEAAAKATADAAAAKAAADADAKRKVAADAARLAAQAEAKRKTDAEASARAVAQAAAKSAPAPEAKSAAATAAATPAPVAATAPAPAMAAKPRADVPACQRNVRDLAAAAKLQFDYASAIIQDETPLVRVASSLRKCPGVRVRVEGHSDSNGDIKRNQALSENRARTVAAFLVASGIAQDRVAAAGYGESRPIVSNDTEANRARNRRIEIVVE